MLIMIVGSNFSIEKLESIAKIVMDCDNLCESNTLSTKAKQMEVIKAYKQISEIISGEYHADNKTV